MSPTCHSGICSCCWRKCRRAGRGAQASHFTGAAYPKEYFGNKLMNESNSGTLSCCMGKFILDCIPHKYNLLKTAEKRQPLHPGWCGSVDCTPVRTKTSLVQFPLRARAWVAGQVPSWGQVRGNQSMFLT